MNPVNRFAIVGAVAQVARVESRAIKGDARTVPVVRARFAAAYLMSKLRPDATDEMIAIPIGRDRSTIPNARKRAAEMLASDEEFVALVAEAEAVACSWRQGEPLPDFVAVDVVKVAKRRGRSPAAKIETSRPADKPTVRATQCSEQYGSPAWYAKYEKLFAGVMAEAHPELDLRARLEAAE